MVQLVLRHTHYNTLPHHTGNPQDVLRSSRHTFSVSCLEQDELLVLRFSGCGVEASLEDADADAAAAAAAAEPASIWDKKFVCVRKVAGSDGPFQRQALRNNTCLRLQAELSTLPPQVKPKQAVRDKSLSQPAVLDCERERATLNFTLF